MRKREQFQVVIPIAFARARVSRQRNNYLRGLLGSARIALLTITTEEFPIARDAFWLRTFLILLATEGWSLYLMQLDRVANEPVTPMGLGCDETGVLCGISQRLA